MTQRCDLREECQARLCWRDNCYPESHDEVEKCLFHYPMPCGHPYLYRTGSFKHPRCAKCKEERALKKGENDADDVAGPELDLDGARVARVWEANGHGDKTWCHDDGPEM